MSQDKRENFELESVSKPSKQWSHVDRDDLMDLPPPLDDKSKEPAWAPLKDAAREKYEATLDDTLVLAIPKPETKEEEQELVRKFLSGVEKLFDPNNNWPFLRPLILTIEHCANCQTCSDACHIYEASGRNPIYRPTCRAEILRRIYYKYIKPGGSFFGKWRHGDIDLNWTTVSRLGELSYRCNLCRRCAQPCPIGADNGLVAREIRKLFSQELDIHTPELHDNGTVLQLKVGSSTGQNSLVIKDNVEFIDEDMEDETGYHVETPWDVEGADVLIMHNAGEMLAWPENPGAFSIILDAAGISWTLSSEAVAYDSVNYGLFYDDFMLSKIVIKHAMAAQKLGVKKIVYAECGHAHKAMTIIADRILTGDLNIPRESSLTMLRDIVCGDKLKLDPSRNDFAVTLHDPCNIVRLMGIVQPQRDILKKIAPKFREMTPHGVDNFCCGGGSGFAIHSKHNFEDWRFNVAGRKKMSQILNAFQDCLGAENQKYVCAPCSNCKGQLRDIIAHYGLDESESMLYGGLVELVVNAMEDCKPGFVKWEEE